MAEEGGTRYCWFFGHSRGCRNGEECPFKHDTGPDAESRLEERTRAKRLFRKAVRRERRRLRKEEEPPPQVPLCYYYYPAGDGVEGARRFYLYPPRTE